MIKIKYPGRNIFTNSISTTKFQLTGQEISVGSGLGRHDKEIILPFYLVKERIKTSLTELMLVGGEIPYYGLCNIFTEDNGTAEELTRCIVNIGSELKIDFDCTSTIIPNSATSFVLNIFSSVDKDKLKVCKGKEGLWIYFFKLKDENYGITNETFFNFDLILDIAHSQGIVESYLLKDESFNEGISYMLEGTNAFHVERNHNIDVLKKYKRGTGLIVFSPFRLSKIDDNSVEIHEMGSIFNKNFKFEWLENNAKYIILSHVQYYLLNMTFIILFVC